MNYVQWCSICQHGTQWRTRQGAEAAAIYHFRMTRDLRDMPHESQVIDGARISGQRLPRLPRLATHMTGDHRPGAS
jgi:hypothetical protein